MLRDEEQLVLNGVKHDQKMLMAGNNGAETG